MVLHRRARICSVQCPSVFVFLSRKRSTPVMTLSKWHEESLEPESPEEELLSLNEQWAAKVLMNKSELKPGGLPEPLELFAEHMREAGSRPQAMMLISLSEDNKLVTHTVIDRSQVSILLYLQAVHKVVSEILNAEEKDPT